MKLRLCGCDIVKLGIRRCPNVPACCRMQGCSLLHYLCMREESALGKDCCICCNLLSG